MHAGPRDSEAVLGNERLTVIASAALLPLALLELLTAANAHVLLPAHIFFAMPALPRGLRDDLRFDPRPRGPGRGLRLSLALGAVAAGAVAAVLVQPAAQPFLDASRGIDFGRGPFVVGVLVTVLAIALLRPLRWRPNPVAEPPP